MRIVIDGRMMGRSTGIYIENLVKYLHSTDRLNEYIVLIQSKSIWSPSAKNFRAVVTDIKDYSFAEQVRMPALLYSLKPDLVHFCMPNQPLLYFGKRVTTIHDLTLVKFENIDMNPFIYRVRKAIFTALLRNVIWRSKAILTPTDYVRNNVLDFSSRKHAHKVIKTLEAGEPLAESAESISSLKGKDFIFFIGNAFPYKNLRRIIEGYMAVKPKRKNLHLVFAGKKDFFYEQHEQFVREHGIADVHFLGFVSEGEKRWLFQNAKAYVVASLSEGFHIPGLEAMHEGCPVISSNASCLPEVYADAAIYFNPTSTRDLADAIETVLVDRAFTANLVKKGRARVKEFSWQRMTEETKAAYDKALGS